MTSPEDRPQIDRQKSEEDSTSVFKERRGSWLQGMLSRSAVFGPSRTTSNIGEDSQQQHDCKQQQQQQQESSSSSSLSSSPSPSCSGVQINGRERSLSLAFMSQFIHKTDRDSIIWQDGSSSSGRERSASASVYSHSPKNNDIGVMEEANGMKERVFDAGEIVHFLSHGPK